MYRKLRCIDWKRSQEDWVKLNYGWSL